MRLRSPRWRPTPDAAGEPDPATVPGPADSVDPAATATAARPTTRRARPRPRPLPSPRTDLDAGKAAAEPGEHLEDDEYWDDEYDDDLEYDDDAEYEDDEYWDDEYDDDFEDEYEDEYEDDFEDEYDELEDDELGDPDADTVEGRRRRLLGRRRKERGRRRGRLGRRSRSGVDSDLEAEPPAVDAEDEPVRPRPRPAPVPVGADDEGATGLALPGVEPADDEIEDDAVSARRRRMPRVPVAAMRASTAHGWTSTRSGVRRGWTATRKGVAAAIHFLRTHWGRAAYIYLAFFGAGLLVTVLLYWHSGFTYDECNYCGMPVLMTVSPWWLLILPFNVSQWPLLLPLFVLVLFAGLNAELFHRWSKRPEPEYPDWD